MRIVLATSGSRGDVQPMIALSLGLQERGHDVLLIGPPEKKQWAQQLGCPYKGLGRNVTAFLDNINNPISIPTAISFVKYVRQEIFIQFKMLPKLIESADILIGSSLMFGLSSLAESLNIRYRYVAFTPQLFKSSCHPFVAIQTQTLPKWCNYLTWEFAQFVDKINITLLVNQHRKKMGLSPVKDALQHIFGKNTILACDSQIASVPLDVTQRHIQTGYLHLKMPAFRYPELENFLEQGSPPIYVGFGSMPSQDQAKHLPMLIHVANQLKTRIVISKFWKQSLEIKIPKEIFFVKNYPHEYLFPKMSAIVHHGGAGTTAAAVLSGKPQVIVPHILDQYYHGYKIFQSGLGAPPIKRSKLNAKRLINALSYCFSKLNIQHQAKIIAKSVKPKDSLDKAIKSIEGAI